VAPEIGRNELLETLKEDFKEFADSCLGILLYGSYVMGVETKRSDVDVCLVKPEEGVFDKVLRKLGGKYDVKVFEELPYYVRIEVIKNHIRVYEKDELDFYLYKQRKIWKDMERRIRENEFRSLEEKIQARKRWLRAKKEILGETRVGGEGS